MDMEYVRTEVCTERHQRNREELKTLETRVNNHGKELDALSVDFAEHVATQAEINRQTLEQLKEQLPEAVAKVIIELEAFDFKQAEENSEQIVLIKLAERLHNMRTMEFMEKAEWKRRAKETIRLFLPMARRIENKKLIDELYDLSVKYL